MTLKCIQNFKTLLKKANDLWIFQLKSNGEECLLCKTVFTELVALDKQKQTQVGCVLCVY